MLIKSTHSNDKIVWGLLSYTFSDESTANEQRDMIDKYRQDKQFEIFLYKQEENANYIGAIVIHIQTIDQMTKQQQITIHRVSLIPSYRGQGYGIDILMELKAIYPNATVLGTLNLSEMVKNWHLKLKANLVGEGVNSDEK